MTISKKTRDVAIVVAAVTLGLLAIFGDGFSDYARKPFWWKFWDVTAVVSAALFIAGVIYVANRSGSKK